jgi:tRNA-modifying protein YgfZ
MTEPASICLLDDVGALRIAGADARKFLQGQLSNDTGHLRADRLLRAGLHNPQGRALALLAMVEAEDGSVLALLPRELLAVVTQLLKRYVLRSKVVLTDDSDALRVYGLASVSQPAKIHVGQQVRYGAGDDARGLLLQPSAAAPPGSTMPREHWRALDIAAGLPYIGTVNSGHFVAQMLNFDCIDALSFGKGCYTGQEIIARAHYRGHVKRRMQRFVTDDAATLRAGDNGRLSDGRHYHVIDAAARDDGRCEFLAVAHLPGSPGDADTGSAAQAHPAGGPLLVAQALPLPYALPD